MSRIGTARRDAAGSAGAPEDDQPIPPVPDQPLRAPRTKRAPPAQKKDRLEQRGFTRPIAAPNQVVPEIQLQLCTLNAAQIINGKLNEAH